MPETTNTIADFVSRHQIRLGAHIHGDIGREARHWQCELTYTDRQMTTYYSQGSTYVNPPTCEEVLICLHRDITTSTFDYWCGQLGYDNDSRKAHRTYRACKKQTRELRTFLGELWQEFLELEPE